MAAKQIILLIWGYHRKGWVDVFNKIDEHFDFHYLFYTYPQLETVCYIERPRHYWSDFSSAQEILERIKPAKVVFMENHSLHTIALNFACKQRGIPTYVLQHGLFHDVKTNLSLDVSRLGTPPSPAEQEVMQANRKHVFPFFLTSLRLRNLADILWIGRWQMGRRKMHDLQALVTYQHPRRLTDYYIVYTTYNGHYFSEVNGARANQLLPIGVPELDSYFEVEAPPSAMPPFDLLIDSAITPIEECFTEGAVTNEQYLAFIRRLAAISRQQGRRLVVKLHPYSYSNPAFADAEDVIFHRDCDVLPLIQHAERVYGFDSTLMLYPIYKGNAILFRLNEESYFAREIVNIGVCPVLDFGNFQDADTQAKSPSHDALKDFVEKFLFKTDGQSYLRLKSILDS